MFFVRDIQFTQQQISPDLASAAPWAIMLVAGFSQRSPGFAPKSVHLQFAVDRLALRQGFRVALRFSPVTIIPPLLRIHSLSIRGGGVTVDSFKAHFCREKSSQFATAEEKPELASSSQLLVTAHRRAERIWQIPTYINTNHDYHSNHEKHSRNA